MKLNQLLETTKDEYSNVSEADYKLWVETLADMIENDKMSFDEAIDVMLDNDPKFEHLSTSAQKKCISNIKKRYYDSIH
jgi:hypothetical protein